MNAVCPGLITTRWFGDGVGQEAYESIKQGYERATPLGRACTAEDVAEAVVWLVDGARTVTGELVLLDSGLDSLGIAILVARLEETLGFDPFTDAGDVPYPVTLGDFISFYEQGATAHDVSPRRAN